MAARQFAPARDFAPPSVPANEEPPQVTEDECRRLVAQAQAEGRAEGFAEGISQGVVQAQGSLETATAGLLRQISDALSHNAARETERLDLVELRATRLVLGLVQKLSSALAERDADTISRRIVSETVMLARRQGSVEFSVHPNDAEALSDRLLSSRVPTGVAERLSITPDPCLSKGSVAARWDGGGVAFDPKEQTALLDGIIGEGLAAIDHALSSTERE